MDWLEQELAQALARKEPAAGFDGRVRARMHPRPQWLAIAATLLVMMGGGEAWRQYHQYQGYLAKEQVMTAMRIAGSKLNRVQMQLKGTEQ
jgi:uridylate kinase